MENINKYRLPTEAQWEYTCRAKSAGRFSFEDDEARLKDYAWFHKNSGNKTHPVGQMRPNAWGLYEMHGNVWEWFQDWYGSYPDRPVNDPKGPGSGESRVLRGGSWNNDTWILRSADRFRYDPDKPGGIYGFSSKFGFRVARMY